MGACKTLLASANQWSQAVDCPDEMIVRISCRSKRPRIRNCAPVIRVVSTFILTKSYRGRIRTLRIRCMPTLYLTVAHHTDLRGIPPPPGWHHITCILAGQVSVWIQLARISCTTQEGACTADACRKWHTLRLSVRKAAAVLHDDGKRQHAGRTKYAKYFQCEKACFHAQRANPFPSRHLPAPPAAKKTTARNTNQPNINGMLIESI